MKKVLIIIIFSVFSAFCSKAQTVKKGGSRQIIPFVTNTYTGDTASILSCQVLYDLDTTCYITWQMKRSDYTTLLEAAYTIYVDPSSINVSTLNDYIFTNTASRIGVTLKSQ